MVPSRYRRRLRPSNRATSKDALPRLEPCSSFVRYASRPISCTGRSSHGKGWTRSSGAGNGALCLCVGCKIVAVVFHQKSRRHRYWDRGGWEQQTVSDQTWDPHSKETPPVLIPFSRSPLWPQVTLRFTALYCRPTPKGSTTVPQILVFTPSLTPSCSFEVGPTMKAKNVIRSLSISSGPKSKHSVQSVLGQRSAGEDWHQ